jgi:anti-sigma B factor antagonist
MGDIEVTQPSGGYVHVRIGGEVDISTRSALDDALRRAIDDHDGAVVIDLSAVRFFSAAGVHCVDATVGALGSRGRPVRVVCPEPGAVSRVVGLLELHRSWPVHHDVASAVASLDRPDLGPCRPRSP